MIVWGDTRRVVLASAALASVVGVGVAALMPVSSVDAQSAVRFETQSLREDVPNAATEREVAPRYASIRSWISAVGAAAAAADLSGAGRAADYCLVDPRDDSVTVGNADPGRADYAPVQLRADDLPMDHTMAPMGCVPADLDEDGDQDLIVYYWGRSPIVFLRVDSGESLPTTSSFAAHEMVSPAAVWNTTALNVGDLDGDGHLDVMVGNYFPDGARVLDPQAAHDTGTVMQDSMSLAHNAGVNRVFRTVPTGTPNEMPSLIDHSTAFPRDSATSWTLAFGLQDLTDDLLPEIYVANDFGPDNLLVNRSQPGSIAFEEIRAQRDPFTPKSKNLGHDSFKGMGVAFSYAPGAELPSIMVSNITSEYALHESNFFFEPTGGSGDIDAGRVAYADHSEELGVSRSGWSWDVKAIDVDNNGVDDFLQATGFVAGEKNGWPQLQELAMANDALLQLPEVWQTVDESTDLSGHEPDRLWLARDGRYFDVGAATGLDVGAVSRGIAVSDLDGDGRLDVIVAKQWAASEIALNATPAERVGTSVYLEVHGAAGASRPAIGAQVRVVSEADSEREQLYPANGHAGVSAPAVHLAPQDAATAEIEVRWRDAAGLHTARTTLPEAPISHVLLNEDGTVTVK